MLLFVVYFTAFNRVVCMRQATQPALQLPFNTARVHCWGVYSFNSTALRHLSIGSVTCSYWCLSRDCSASDVGGRQHSVIFLVGLCCRACQVLNM